MQQKSVVIVHFDANPLTVKRIFLTLMLLFRHNSCKKPLHTIKIHQILIEQFSNFLVPMTSFNNAHLDLNKNKSPFFLFVLRTWPLRLEAINCKYLKLFVKQNILVNWCRLHCVYYVRTFFCFQINNNYYIPSGNKWIFHTATIMLL